MTETRLPPIGTHARSVTLACLAAGEAPPNVDPATNIHYGVICAHSLYCEMVDSIQTFGEDVTYRAWKEEAHADAQAAITKVFEDLMVDGKSLTQAIQTEAKKYDSLSGLEEDTAAFVAQEVVEKLQLELDGLSGDLSNDVVDSLSEQCFCTESFGPYIWDVHEDGTCVVRLDSDNDVWVLKSRYFTFVGECSPCAPNAGHLDTSAAPGRGLRTYCLDAEDWFDAGHSPCPYPVYEVSYGKLVYSPHGVCPKCGTHLTSDGLCYSTDCDYIQEEQCPSSDQA